MNIKESLDVLFEDTNNIKRILFTVFKSDTGNVEASLDKLTGECDKRSIKYFIGYHNTLKFETIDDKMFAINTGDDAKFEINPKNTIIVNRVADTVSFLRYLDETGFKIINSRTCLNITSDKYQTSMLLKDHDLPQPKFTIVRSETEIPYAIDEIGTFPLVIKSLDGCGGK
jgi:glutathione synthase/RimK-type ligase-like ATP-grasp enzyme